MTVGFIDYAALGRAIDEAPAAKPAKPAKPRMNKGFETGESVAKNGEKRLISPQEVSERLKNDQFTAPKYPIDALGPLSGVAKAIRDEAQVPAAMAGQSILAAAALVTQHTANVQTLAGRKPLSLYALTIAESGEGKSTAEGPALQAVRAFQRERGRVYAMRVKDAEAANRGKGEAPQELPPEPWLITRDATVEGIRRSFANGIPSQGAFTSEAAVMMSGYGMSKENRAKTAGTFNALWDDGELSVSRATAARVQLYDRRFSKHFLIQPDAVRESLNDPLLESIGYWPRYLVAWPDPAEPRKARPFQPERNKAIGAYWARCSELLSDMPEDGCSNLPVIEANSQARAFIEAFFERMEVEARTGDLQPIKPFALRATEQLFRVAGVMTAFMGGGTITLETAQNAAKLVSYSLDTWSAIFGKRQESEAVKLALRLFDWMHAKGGTVSEIAILQTGPRATRGRSSRDKALAILEGAGVVSNMGSGYWSINEAENHD